MIFQMDFSEIGQAFPIKTINLYQLDFSLKSSFPFRTNSSLTAIKPIIVEMIDLEDRVGWGSIDFWDHPFNPLQQDRTGAETWRIITQSFIPALKLALMKPQLHPYRAVDQIHQITSKYPPIAAGFEMAYWDLLIRKENCRSVELFWRLFFEEGRSQFEADDYDIMETKMKQGFNCKARLQLAKDFHIIENQIQEYMKHNIYSFTVPIIQNLDFMTNIINNIRERFPEIILDTDANGWLFPNYNVKWEKIVEFYQSLDQYRIRYHEQPFMPKPSVFELMEKLAQKIKTPLGWDESLVDLSTLDRILALAGKDNIPFYLNWKVPQIGGYRNLLRSLVKVDLHNQHYPEARCISVPGFSFDTEISVFGTLALFTLPPKVSDCEYIAMDEWCEISIFKPTITRIGGQWVLSDQNGLGTRFVKNGTTKHVLRTYS